MLDFELEFCGLFHSDAAVDYHSHRGVELVWQAAGRCRHQIVDREWTTDCGWLLVIPPHTAHRQISLSRQPQTIYISFLNNRDLFDPSLRIEFFGHDHLVGAWFSALFEIWNLRPSHYERICQGLLHALTARLSGTPEPAAPEQWLQQARFLLDNRFMTIRSIEEVAEECGVSRNHFAVGFKRAFGQSPLEYLTRRRLNYAANLLRSPYREIKQIARQCGFTDANYFARIFKKRFGCTPSDFKWNRHFDSSEWLKPPERQEP